MKIGYHRWILKQNTDTAKICKIKICRIKICEIIN